MNDINPSFVPSFSTFPKIKARILVVDDQTANIQVVGSSLSNLGHEIVPTTDGPSALKRIAFKKPDLILLDILMPDMDGYEVCKKIRENQNWLDIPIIFLSAADDKSFIVRALELGAVDYITKPFNQSELVCRVHTHLELKFTRDRLAQIAQDKEELYGVMAHDCKSLLGGINMTAQLLLEKIEAHGDKTLLPYIENIENSSGQMLRFVKQFLANASWENNFRVDIQPVNLKETAQKIVSLFKVKADSKKLKVHFDVPPEETFIAADPMALEQILNNLVSNALKFSPPDKNVFIRIFSRNEDWICEIEDEGPGFQKADFQKMFQRYSRLSAKPTSGEPSTGLGLSIVKKLADTLQAKLRCDSEPGRGAKFTLKFSKSTPHQ